MWADIRGQTSTADVVVHFCYRPAHQQGETDEAFLRQVEKATQSQALVLLGNLSTPISSGRPIQVDKNNLDYYVEDNFLMQLINKLVIGIALFRDLLVRILWGTVLESKGAQKNRLIFKDSLL